MHEALFLAELVADGGPVRRVQPGLVVVAVDGGRHATVQQGSRAPVEKPTGVGRIGSSARPREQHVLDVALGEGALAGRHLHDGRLVLRARGREDREGHGQRRNGRERNEDRPHGAATAGGEWPERRAPAHAYWTTSLACMPPW